MRPKTIVYFEGIMFGSILIGILENYLDWDGTVQAAQSISNNLPVAFTLTILIFSFVVAGALTLLVSRRRSKVAMWVLIALYAFNILVSFDDFIQSITGGLLRLDFIIPALQNIGEGVAYALLFTPSARRWMRREDEQKEKLREVFD
jgi:peptidoglycan/LPS O-acetylase OafA/YrhL